MTTTKDILEHYGTKGMRWGVRKERKYSSKNPRKHSVVREIKNSPEAKAVKAVAGSAGAKKAVAGAKAIGKAAVTPQRSFTSDVGAIKKGAKNVKEKVLAKIQKNQEKNAVEAAAGSKEAGKVSKSMASEASGKSVRSAKTLRSESASLREVQKVTGLPSDHARINEITKRNDKAARNPKKRASREQTKSDADWLKELSSDLAQESVSWSTHAKNTAKKRTTASHSTEDISTTIMAHYGTKGMRWGVRKESAAAKTASTLNDSDLSAKIKRLQMEKQYVELSTSASARDKSMVEAGARYVGNVMQQSADYSIRQAANQQAVSILTIATSAAANKVVKKVKK